MTPSIQTRFPIRYRNLCIVTGWVFACLLLNGCGYLVGSAHQVDVQTVYVPIFESESYRRDLEFQLTEAVQKQILSQTPYRLAKGPYADTRLTGRILQIKKDLLLENQYDDVREFQLEYAVEVTWEDMRNQRILAQQQFPITPELIHLVSDSSVAPEVGQSFATGNKQAMDRMARQIVEMMETPW